MIRGCSTLAAGACTTGGGGVPVGFVGAQGDLGGLTGSDQRGAVAARVGGARRSEREVEVEGKAANTARITTSANGAYSYRKHSIGSSRDALRAGHTPKINPTRIETDTPVPTAQSGIVAGMDGIAHIKM